MKERPIIFSDAMVRAILAGRKTQTRRVIPNNAATWRRICFATDDPRFMDKAVSEGQRKYGQPGDRLWVRETFTLETNFNIEDESVYPPPFSDGRPVNRIEDDAWGDYWEQPHYKATDPAPELVYEDMGECESGVRWRSPRFMPRWASRITLEAVSVRAERLQDISATDIEAEGVDCLYEPDTRALSNHYNRQIFQTAWNKINAKRGFSWDMNPWVWVIEFKKVQP